MKHEWKKAEKALYAPGKEPVRVFVPSLQYIMIKGQGNPNGEDFSMRVGALYSVAYSIKMRYKKRCMEDPKLGEENGCTDYTVFPLEGVWTSSSADPLDKDRFLYTIMIRQPGFICNRDFEEAKAEALKKKPGVPIGEVGFDSLAEGDCVQMLHTGPYDDEPASFLRMEQFCKENGLVRTGSTHREIYLTDAKKTEPSKYKTILRFCVKEALS